MDTLEITPEVDKLAHITQVEAEIARMRNEYSSLEIKDLNDRKGFEAVERARISVKNVRVSVEKERKALVEDSVKWQKQVNSVAKGIISQLEEIEIPLQAKEDEYKMAKIYAKQEEERKKRELIQKRSSVILSLDSKFDGSTYILGTLAITQDQLEGYTDDQFQTTVEQFEAEYQTILKDRLEAERVAKEEADRIEAQRLEQEAAAAEIKRMQDELAAERKKIDDEKAAHEAELKRIQDEKNRQAELEAARKDAAEKAIIQEKIKAEKEAAEKAEAERISAEKVAKALAKRPDIEKYNDMINKIVQVVNSFEFSTEEGNQAHQDLRNALNAAVKMSPLKL